jgi:hypothetical protein
MGSVVEKEALVAVSSTKMGPQQRQHPVLGCDLSSQNTPQLGKAGEALEKMSLTPQVPHGLEHRVEGFIREVVEEGRALPKELYYDSIEVEFLFRQTGEKAPAQQIRCAGVAFYDFAEHPGSVLAIRWDGSDGEEGGLHLILRENAAGVFPVQVAVEDAAQESFKGAVVAVDCFAHGMLLFTRGRTKTAAPPPAGAAEAARQR